jgi:hypothetical protein
VVTKTNQKSSRNPSGFLELRRLEATDKQLLENIESYDAENITSILKDLMERFSVPEGRTWKICDVCSSFNSQCRFCFLGYYSWEIRKGKHTICRYMYDAGRPDDWTLVGYRWIINEITNFFSRQKNIDAWKQWAKNSIEKE